MGEVSKFLGPKTKTAMFYSFTVFNGTGPNSDRSHPLWSKNLNLRIFLSIPHTSLLVKTQLTYRSSIKVVLELVHVVMEYNAFFASKSGSEKTIVFLNSPSRRYFRPVTSGNTQKNRKVDFENLSKIERQ